MVLVVSLSWGLGEANWPPDEGAGALGWGFQAQPHLPTQPQRGTDWAQAKLTWGNGGTLRAKGQQDP